MSADTQRQFTDLVKGPEEHINLAEAALLIAGEEYPELDVRRYLKGIEGLAEELRSRIPPSAHTTDRLAALNRFLFEEKGFRGNSEDYYDPRNSFLNEVLDRRLGIPVTLALVYLEVGRRIGLPLEGVSFPGHFLVKCPVPEGDIVLDPYARGASLSEDDLVEKATETFGEAEAARVRLPYLLEPATKKDMLVRMLRNLKVVYLSAGEPYKALQVTDLTLRVQPDTAGEIRDRGQIYHAMGHLKGALADYRRYLELLPEADDAEDIADRIAELEQAPPYLI